MRRLSGPSGRLAPSTPPVTLATEVGLAESSSRGSSISNSSRRRDGGLCLGLRRGGVRESQTRASDLRAPSMAPAQPMPDLLPCQLLLYARAFFKLDGAAPCVCSLALLQNCCAEYYAGVHCVTTKTA